MPKLPAPTGLALFRYAIDLGRRPHVAMTALHHEFGPVSRVGFGSQQFVYLLGPKANEFVFTHSDLFRWREAFDILVPVGGETALIVSDGDDHKRRRRLVQPAFGRRQLDGYLELMTANADATLDRWQPGQRINVYQEFRAAVRATTIEALFGRRLAAEAAVIGADLQPMLGAIDQHPSLQAMGRRGLTPLWRRAMKAKARVDARIFAEIAQRRAEQEPDGGRDILTRLIQASDADDGSVLSDLEIRDQVVSLIAAGYETTSAAVAWTIYAMLSTPQVWDRAVAEVDAVLGDRTLTAADLTELTYLDGVVSETLRLYPPAMLGARYVAEPFEYEGYAIPAGHTVIFSQYVTHRLPELWAEPEQFRPERWDRSQPDHRVPTPYEYLPFGGSSHRCIGAQFATMEIKAMLVQLLRRVQLELEPQQVQGSGTTTLRPRGGLLVRVGSSRVASA